MRTSIPDHRGSDMKFPGGDLGPSASDQERISPMTEGAATECIDDEIRQVARLATCVCVCVYIYIYIYIYMIVAVLKTMRSWIGSQCSDRRRLFANVVNCAARTTRTSEFYTR